MTALETYRKKRDFEKTSEPPGGNGGRRSSAALAFVVHKHDAQNLHYDLRLECSGTLKSWAVPKGPSDDPGDKRLAIEVEDHPLEYAEFEGVIPKGEYGAGPVLVWDRGTWQTENGSDPVKALESGRLKFTLDGEKLKGRWTLTKMKGRGDNQWLLIKHKDRWASPGEKIPIVERDPRSVKSGRTIDEVKGGERRKIEGARSSAAVPKDVKPELATLVDAAPEGTGWVHEIKYDGYRILAYKEGENVRLLSRNGKDWSRRFHSVVTALKGIEGNAVLDGEVVVLDEQGLTSFQSLQRALKEHKKDALVYYVFDILWADGEDLRGVSLTERKSGLREMLRRSGMLEGQIIRYSDHLQGNGEAFFRQACKTGLEGIICKKASSPYRGRRTRDWLKVKCGKRQEFVVGGFTEPSGSRQGFGALLLGVYKKGNHKDLRYAGRVGTGFNDATLKRLRETLDGLIEKTSPFDDGPTGREARGVTWVRPELVAEVSFTEWTEDGRLRHPSFLGLREDKPAREVGREEPIAPKKNARKEKGIMKVAGIQISHSERPVFPDAGITKGEVAEYYAGVGEELLRYIAGRPLSVVRCPEGRQKQCFYQKHHSPGMPDSIGTVQVKERSSKEGYMTVNSVEGVIALAQFGVLEIHPWLARNDRLDRPDLMVFDLDPAEDVAWEEVLGAGYLLRDILGTFDLQSFPKLTGGKGLHVVAPMTRRLDFDTIKPACKAIVEMMRERNPDKFLVTASKAKRKGKIFLDYLRNGRGATAVAPYSLRARPGAPVALPVSWDEVKPSLRPDQYTIKTAPQRLASLKSDPWKGYFEVKQSLKRAVLRELGVGES